MVRGAFTVTVLFLCLFLACSPVCAVEVDLPLEAFYAAIPDSVREALPEGVLVGEELPDGEEIRDAGSLGAMMGYLRDALYDALPRTGRLFGRLLLCTVFSALFGTLCTSFGGERGGEIARFCGRICTAGILLEAQLAELETLRFCLRQLQTLVNGMIPVLGVLLAAGGNTAAASAGCGSLMLFLNLGENLCKTVFLPLIAVSCGFSAVAWLSGGGRLRGILVCLRRVTTFGLGLFGAIFSAVFAFQTVLSAGADSVAARTVRFAVGSAVPVIGGAVGDAVRTVGSALHYLKDTVGLLGILLTALLVLPPLVRLLLYRATLTLNGAAAELLGAEQEGKLIFAFADLGGVLLALLCVAVLCFIFALVLFVRLTLAIGR